MRRTGRPALALRAALLLAVACAPACAPRPAATGRPVPLADVRAMPKVDVHAHYRADHPGLVDALAAWNARAVLVNVTGDDRQIDRKWRDFQALQARYPERFFLVATFDPFRFEEPDFVPRVVAQLRADVAAGARAVKVWKDVGMELKDAAGRHVQIDHPRFQPIWDFLAEQGVPVMAHIGEPLAAWRPLDEASPHYFYYRDNPRYHAYQHPEIPRHEEIIAARDRWLARNPRLVVVGMHLGSLEHDVREVARRLDAYPNFHVETAARIGDLGTQPGERVRDFLIRYQDRVMWGTDFGEGSITRAGLEASLDQHWRYYAGADTVTLGNRRGWRRTVTGLALPRAVLEKFARRNAERVLKLPAARAP